MNDPIENLLRRVLQVLTPISASAQTYGPNIPDREHARDPRLSVGELRATVELCDEIRAQLEASAREENNY